VNLSRFQRIRSLMVGMKLVVLALEILDLEFMERRCFTLF